MHVGDKVLASIDDHIFVCHILDKDVEYDEYHTYSEVEAARIAYTQYTVVIHDVLYREDAALLIYYGDTSFVLDEHDILKIED